MALNQLATPTLSWRRLAVLIDHLPPDAVVVRRVTGREGDWRLAEHLLASAVDSLRTISWQLSGDAHVAPPAPIQRPGMSSPGEKRIGGSRSFTIDELRARLANRRRRRGGS